MTAAVKTEGVFAAFLAVQKEIGSIRKAQRVQSGPAQFAFRGIDDVMNALHPLMSKHSLICLPQVQERIQEARVGQNRTFTVIHLRVKFVFHGLDGSSMFAETWGEGQDTGDKATGKAHSMSMKTALLQAFVIPTEDTPDTDYDTTPAEPRQESPAQPNPEWVAQWDERLSKAETKEEWQAAWRLIGEAVTGRVITPAEGEGCRETWKAALQQHTETQKLRDAKAAAGEPS